MTLHGVPQLTEFLRKKFSTRSKAPEITSKFFKTSKNKITGKFLTQKYSK